MQSSKNIPFCTLSHKRKTSSFPSTLPNALSTLQIFNTEELVASEIYIKVFNLYRHDFTRLNLVLITLCITG